MLKYIVAASCLHLTNSNLQKSNLPSHHTRLCTLSLYDHEYLQRRRPRQLEPTRRGLKGPGLRFFWSGASGPSLLTKEEIQYQ